MRFRVGAMLAVMGAVGLACCSGSALLTPALPAGWKTVAYHGIAVDVPTAWVVEPWRQNCGVTAPTVFIGPAKPSLLFCPEFTTGAAEVVLGALPVGRGLSTESENINGLSALARTAERDVVFHGLLGATVTITTIDVTLPARGVSISVSVGGSAGVPGGAPGRAEQIVQTIHSVRSQGIQTSSLLDLALSDAGHNRAFGFAEHDLFGGGD
jgi:hypothetical protein